MIGIKAERDEKKLNEQYLIGIKRYIRILKKENYN